MPDPAAVEGTEAERTQAFRDAYRQKIKAFVVLPIDKLDRMATKREADRMGHTSASPEV